MEIYKKGFKKPKIAIIYPEFGLGGSEARPLWLITALKDEYDVFLITTGNFNLEKLNIAYGTNLKKEDFKIILIKPGFRLFKKFDALRNYKIIRFCKKNFHNFDLMISGYNTMDFGGKGIQFIADFSFSDELRRHFDSQSKSSRKWFYKKSFLRIVYLWFAKIISGSSKNGFKNNITVSNSKWTAGVIKDKFGINSRIIYPSVVGGGNSIPFEDREMGFLCVGRISPEKRIEKIISIIKKVREVNKEIHLHIIGGRNESEYCKLVKKLCEDNKEWCFFEGEMIGSKKNNFIASHKFGISGRENEPFGISVAEMVKSGCIVFVPNGGGQTEIVLEKSLIYEDENDAVKKIKSVLDNGKLQSYLLLNLLESARRFSEEIFMKEAKEIIKNFFENGK